MTEFVVAIPARFGSTRLPGKPLQLLNGKPLIAHVAQRALQAGASEVWVAADDKRIADAVRDMGVQVAMTGSHHESGTDRLAECAAIAGWSAETIVVNLQGDEPFAPATGIQEVARLLDESAAPMSTLCAVIADAEELFDPNVVKVVMNQQGEAMYFSRAPIPFARDAFAQNRQELPDNFQAYRHIGIYAYRAGFLQTFTSLRKGVLESVESLEQLRVMEAGYRIAVGLTPEAFPPGIDTPQDLERAGAHLKSLEL